MSFVDPDPAESRAIRRGKGRGAKPTTGKNVDDAMDAIERYNPRLEGALNKNYGRADLDKHSLGDLRIENRGIRSHWARPNHFPRDKPSTRASLQA